MKKIVSFLTALMLSMLTMPVFADEGEGAVATETEIAAETSTETAEITDETATSDETQIVDESTKIIDELAEKETAEIVDKLEETVDELEETIDETAENSDETSAEIIDELEETVDELAENIDDTALESQKISDITAAAETGEEPVAAVEANVSFLPNIGVAADENGDILGTNYVNANGEIVNDINLGLDVMIEGVPFDNLTTASQIAFYIDSAPAGVYPGDDADYLVYGKDTTVLSAQKNYLAVGDGGFYGKSALAIGSSILIPAGTRAGTYVFKFDTNYDFTSIVQDIADKDGNIIGRNQIKDCFQYNSLTVVIDETGVHYSTALQTAQAATEPTPMPEFSVKNTVIALATTPTVGTGTDTNGIKNPASGKYTFTLPLKIRGDVGLLGFSGTLDCSGFYGNDIGENSTISVSMAAGAKNIYTDVSTIYETTPGSGIYGFTVEYIQGAVQADNAILINFNFTTTNIYNTEYLEIPVAVEIIDLLVKDGSGFAALTPENALRIFNIGQYTVNGSSETLVNITGIKPEFLPNDINLDGVVNLADLMAIVQNINYGLEYDQNCDVCLDGVVNIVDIAYMKRYLLG